MFLLEYIKNPRVTGAVAPSSQHLAEKMIDTIDSKKAKYIVEYGPGTGVFTEKILSRAKNNSTIIIIEINEEFYKNLKNKYGHKENVIIINDSAENIDVILKENNIQSVDYVVSGLPFASLPSGVSSAILRKTNNILHTNGVFITFQYSKLKLKLFKKYFKNISYNLVLKNIPSAYVIQCEKKRK